MGTASACQVQVQPAGQSYVAGAWPASGAWALIDPTDDAKGVTYSMTGAQTCYASGSPADYQSIIQFTCAPEAGPITITVPQFSCTQTYVVPTPLACPGSGGSPSKSGLSGGWIFIIILCVVIPLYVIVGCIYKSQKLGATGMDKCPNVEFWRDLPALIKEGCVVTATKIRGLCGGGGGGSGKEGSYETM